MQFAVIAAVLIALGAADRAPAVPVHGEFARLALVLVGMALVTLFARLAAGATAMGLQRDFNARRDVLRRFERWRCLHAGLWLAVVAATVFGLDWAQLVRGNWQLAQTFLADDVLIMTPVLLPLVLSWAAFYEVDRTMHTQIARQSGQAHHAPTRAAYVIYHIRHYLALVMVPLIAALALHDGLELAAPQVLESRAAWWFMTLPLAALFVVFPLVLRYVWDTQALPRGPLRSRLEAAGKAVGVSVQEIFVWRSGGLICNAAVAGLLPSLRYVFVSDGLLARSHEAEISAVYAHELAHVRHRHLALRAIALVLPIVLWQTAQEISERTVGAAVWDGPLGILGVSTAGLEGVWMLLYVVTLFAWYCRQLEYQADATACGMGGLQGEAAAPCSVDDFVAALRTVAAAGGGNRKRGGLLHPAVDQRVQRLRRLAAEPAEAIRLQWRMACGSRTIVVTCAAAIAVWLAALLA